MQFAINPKRQVTIREVGIENTPLIVVDDWLQSPHELVAYAQDASLEWVKPDTSYPGVWAEVPPSYQESLIDVLLPALAECYGIETRPTFARSQLALCTAGEENLSALQRCPHFDDVSPIEYASVHYLCSTPHSGTAIFRHRATGYEKVNEIRLPKYLGVLMHELQDEDSIGSSYCTDSNSLFRKIFESPAKFNRLIAYPSQLLHSALIRDECSLTPDPRVGRLTTTNFFRF